MEEGLVGGGGAGVMSKSMTCSYGTTRGGLALIQGSVLFAGIAVDRACYGVDMVGCDIENRKK
jgi:hypothetical protein